MKENIIVCASNNAHKIVEIEEITKKFGLTLVSRDDAGVPPFEIEEDGDTFEANSYKKAAEILAVCGKPTLADDSGLMVDYLDGAPGVYSARFAGEHGGDKANNEKLLRLMDGVPEEKRTAKFVSVITMIFPAEEGEEQANGATDGCAEENAKSSGACKCSKVADNKEGSEPKVVARPGKVLVARGECPGRVLTEEHGDGGFGYDPLFLPDGYDKTFGELPQETKNKISHRANALKELERMLKEIK